MDVIIAEWRIAKPVAKPVSAINAKTDTTSTIRLCPPDTHA